MTGLECMTGLRHGTFQPLGLLMAEQLELFMLDTLTHIMGSHLDRDLCHIFYPSLCLHVSIQSPLKSSHQINGKCKKNLIIKAEKWALG